MSCWGKRKWDPKGKHCYVTGGSKGLGLALSILLTKQGAHVSIVARNEKDLKDALDKIKDARISDDQIFRSYSFSLSSPEGSQAALDAVMSAHDGKTPDASFLCAGGSKPKFFVEMTSAELTEGMNIGYWVQAWSAWAITREMVKQQRKGRITLVASLLGYMTVLGYTSYAPAKHALKALADTLRSELLLYDISVHVFMPPTIYTTGYEEENKTKPKITLKIEENDTGLTAEQAAILMLNGVKNNESHITGNFISELFRVSTRGSAPGHFFLWDWGLSFIAAIGVPIWRMSVDSSIIGHREEHKKYLAERRLLQD